MNFQDVAKILFLRGYEPIPVEGKSPVTPDWVRTPIDAQRVENWVKQYPAMNVGVRNIGALDFDIYHDPLAAEMLEIVKSRLSGSGLVRYGQRPKFLIPVRLESGIKNKCHSIGVREPGTEGPVSKVEVLGKGSQWVMYGVHPGTRQDYEWEGGDICDVSPDDLPLVTFELVSELFREFDRLCELHGLESCQPMNQKSAFRPAIDGRELNPQMPGDDYIMKTDLLELVTDAGWIDTGVDMPQTRSYTLPDGSPSIYRFKQRMLIRPGKSVDGDQNYTYSGNIATIGGVQMLYIWSTSVPELEADRTYNAFQFYTAMKHGGDFNAAARELRCQGYGGTSALEDFADLEGRDPLEVFCGRYVLIAEGKRVVDLEIPHDGIMLTLDEFTCHTAHLRANDVANPPPLARVWARDPRRKMARTTTYQPGEDVLIEKGPGVYDYNIYHRPEWTYTKERNLIVPIIEHFEYLLGDRDSVDFKYYIGWHSHLLHKPRERPTVTPLLISPYHGTGRGYIDQLTRRCLGGQNCSTTTMTDLARGQFHDHLANRLFCSLAEVKENRRLQFQINDEIRETLTATHMFLNLKYGKKGDYPIFTRIHMTSNHRDCVIIPAEDRRMFVTICTLPPLPRAHYVKIYELLTEPAAIDQWMSYTLDHHRLIPWDAKADAPMNAAKLSLIATGATPIEQAFTYVINRTDLPEVGMFPQIFAEVLHELDTNEWFGSGDDAEPGNVNSQVKALLRGRCASLERTQFTLPGGMQVRGQVWILRNEKNWGKASREEITQEIGGWPSANVNSLRKTNHLGELKQLLQ